mmetsp:Transcript_13979/g.32110  ORF Transcript_13979/g.32110 Transcript_13979/m.32110 type:complete len:80 (-) Transcript_13979:935-1174(-)
MGSDDKLAESNGSSGGRTPPGYNQTKRQWARGFLWVTAILLLFDRPLLSLGTVSRRRRLLNYACAQVISSALTRIITKT